MSRYQPYRVREPSHAELLALPDGSLALASTYDAGLVQALKQAVPWEARRWDGSNRQWIVAAQYGEQIARIVEAYLGVVVSVPEATGAHGTETRLVYLEYLGQCKDRGSGESSAFGWVDGNWNLSVSEPILRAWFEAVPQRFDEKPTLFAVLAVKQTASSDEVRSAYRRLARQTHPDVCKEPDTDRQFKAISHAYEILSNEALRQKYTVGLALEASLKQGDSWPSWKPVMGYRSPLRCGWILVEGQEVLGRFVISTIFQWEDVVRGDGKVLCTSWPPGEDHFVEAWV